ncbi:DUF5987 family protein [Dactylosporangium sp. NPDC051485]|uniref:DUF5987 family protein n=1 Tax=Dactylosporangium sp. NPDC051485 TaxID=3154846 RepID=UPI0034211708
MTLEAFADTVLPGERRWDGDRAVAGAATGDGAVAAGALEVLQDPAGGIAGLLDGLVDDLNEHAAQYAAELGVVLDDAVPAFVGLQYAERAGLLQRLTAAGHPEKEVWVGLVMFSYMAFDAAPHMHTVDAIADGHPGLRLLGFQRPDATGLWRFDAFSYGRPLADLHPDTTPTGSPA